MLYKRMQIHTSRSNASEDEMRYTVSRCAKMPFCFTCSIFIC